MTKPVLVPVAMIGLFLPAAGMADVPASPADAPTHVVRMVEGFTSQRPPGETRDPLSLSEIRTPSNEVAVKARTTDSQTRGAVVLGDFWIYDASAELFDDFDGDGYYHYLRVRIDADTYYDHAYVYAKLYLSSDGLTWELYATTHEFWIDGSTALDEYEVETELVAGYPHGLYDVLIELYSADHGVLVDEFGPAETSALALLPLEDLSYDGVAPPPVSHSAGHGGGGALTWLLLPLALAAWRRSPSALGR